MGVMSESEIMMNLVLLHFSHCRDLLLWKKA